MSEDRWRRCSVCKGDIRFRDVYWVCSVSTCNRKRTGLVFCSTSCWDAHVPVMRHRESWAVEERAPASAQAAGAGGASVQPHRAEPPLARASSADRPGSQAPAAAPVRRRILATATPTETRTGPPVPREVLIVVSKLKQYIRAASGMNTSDAVAGPLSDHVRALCDAAIEAARRSERKTVLERDVPPVRRGGWSADE